MTFPKFKPALKTELVVRGCGEEPMVVPPLPVTKSRPCLSCSTPFESDGPGNRICRRCKHGSEWRAGVSYRSARA